MVAVLAVLVMAGLGPLSAGALAASFSDVGSGDWFSPAVNALADAGVVSGYEDGTFRPYETVTRAQFASMLARAIQPPQVLVEPFEDVYSVDWFFGSVASLYQAGLISGTSPTMFSPNQSIDRQQTCTLLMRALAYRLQSQPQEGIDLGLSSDGINLWLGGFKDRWLISDGHRLSVANAFRLAIVSGSGDGWFYPQFTLTRAQATGMLYSTLYKPLQPRANPPQAVPAVETYPDLRIGSTGPYVVYLEKRLASLRYDCGHVDDTYDEATKDAVMAFQKVEGLTRDGEAGAQVWQRLASAGIPALRDSAGGNRVEIDLSRQVLFLVNNGSIVKILPVATGRSGFTTPSGRFHIERKLSYWRRSALGLLYMPSYFYNGIAIHGSYSVPAYVASHGCVRIPVWATPALYAQLPVGIPVYLYY
jgi:N-acetylmuramoyl-L-alanine amidase